MSKKNQQNGNVSGTGSPEKPNTNLHVFLKTGGPQPTSLEPSEINQYFLGNYAKVWIMTRGFYPIFKDYKEKTIAFKLIIDPRFHGDGLLLSMWIAKQYKMEVDLLRDAEFFDVNEYHANDIIGFHVPPETPAEEIDVLYTRISKSMGSLPDARKFLHHGRIR